MRRVIDTAIKYQNAIVYAGLMGFIIGFIYITGYGSPIINVVMVIMISLSTAITGLMVMIIYQAGRRS